jgi:cytochrome c biogenesis protein CcdA
MSEFISQYYAWLSSLANWVTPPLGAVADSINIPVVSVLLFGLIGAVAPCQLSTNVATLAFLSRGVTDARKIGAQTLALVAGKLTVYLIVGGLVVVLGLQINQLSRTVIPIVIVARRVLGPLLIIVGLFMLSILQLKFSVGTRFSFLA